MCRHKPYREREREREWLEIDKNNFFVEREAGLKSYVVRQASKWSGIKMYFVVDLMCG